MSSKQEDPDIEAMRAAHEAELAEKRAFVLPKEIPPFSWAALFMPPIWGPAHGQWITICFYPLWLFTDSVLRTAYYTPTSFNIGAGILIFTLMAAVTIFYAATAQKPAYYRVKDRYTPERYAKRERIWTISMVFMGAVFIALATWYNLAIYRP